MARRDRNRTFDSEAGILPLINVVFLLLVFFMLAGTLTTQDLLEIEPTMSRSETEAGDQDFIVLVGVEGQLAVDDAELDLDGVTRLVAERLVDAPDAVVWVKADARSDAVALVDVLDRLREAGVDEVRLLTTKGGD